MECRSDVLVKSIEKIVEKYGNERENLLSVLNAVNRKFGAINGETLVEISRIMDVSIAEIHGVGSFYSFINMDDAPKNTIRVCQSISCDMAGKNKIVELFESELGIKFGEVTKDKMFKLEFTNCMGMCDKGPAVMVNQDIYTHVCCEDVLEIIDKYKGGNK
jgi:NADH:ubiquinone oxidoreductase subunit E